ncbi:MAG: sigma-70 family RNA polymerase sigma factor [Candidatus Cybelea sp.]
MKPREGKPARSLDAESREQFQSAAESYRRELRVHCYRILGSIHEAEDAVQETMLRGWRSFESFEGRSSLPAWLYRIATNVCLNLLAKRSTARRTLPELNGSPADRLPGEPSMEIAWLEPYPDAVLEHIADTDPGPHARYEQREAMRLAFIAAIQYLPGRQRAALLLHDVVGWSGAETAEMLDMSAAAVNSALQRARATLKKHTASADRGEREVTTVRQRALLDRYVRAWEAKDLDGLVALLKKDAVLSMPPLSEWYQGHDAIRAVCAYYWTAGTLPYSAFRLIETSANGQPAFALYARSTDDSKWHAHVIQVLTVEGDSISALTYFVNPDLFRAFGLPAITRS